MVGCLAGEGVVGKVGRVVVVEEVVVEGSKVVAGGLRTCRVVGRIVGDSRVGDTIAGRVPPCILLVVPVPRCLIRLIRLRRHGMLPGCRDVPVHRWVEQNDFPCPWLTTSTCFVFAGVVGVWSSGCVRVFRRICCSLEKHAPSIPGILSIGRHHTTTPVTHPSHHILLIPSSPK